jgi:hypothetical protein
MEDISQQATGEKIQEVDAVIARLHATRDPALTEHLYAAYLRKSELLRQAADDDSPQALQDAMAAPLDALLRHASDPAKPQASAQVAEALYLKAELQFRYGRDNDAIATCYNARARFGDAADPDLRSWLVRTEWLLFRRRTRLGTFARVDAVREARAGMESWTDDRAPEVFPLVSAFALDLGDVLEAMDYIPAAIETWDALQKRLAGAHDPVLREIGAKAMLWTARQQKMQADAIANDEVDGDDASEDQGSSGSGQQSAKGLHDTALATIEALLARYEGDPYPVRLLCLRADAMRNAILRRYATPDLVGADIDRIRAEYARDENPETRDTLRKMEWWRLELLSDSGEPQAAIRECDALVARNLEGCDADSIDVLLRTLELKQRLLRELDRPDEADRVLEPLIERHKHHPDPAVPRKLLGTLLRQGDRADARALEIFDTAMRCFRESTDAEVQQLLAGSHVSQISLLVKLHRDQEALGIADALISHYAGSPDAQTQACVAQGLINKAMALQRLGRGAEERAVYREVIARIGLASAEPVLRELAAQAHYWLVRRHLDEDADLAAAQALTADLERTYGDDEHPAVRIHAINATHELGSWFVKNDRHQEAVSIFDAIVVRTIAEKDDAMRQACARAMLRKAQALLSDQPHAALGVADALLARFDRDAPAHLRQILDAARQARAFCIAKLRELPGAAPLLPADAAGPEYDQAFALIDQGDAMSAKGEIEEALACYDRVIAGHANASHPDLRFVHALALHQKSSDLLAHSRYSRVIECADEMIARHGDQQGSRFSTLLAKVLLDRALALGKLKRIDEAIDWYDMVFQRFGDATNPKLREYVSQALYNKAVFMDGIAPPQALEAAYAAVIDHGIVSSQQAMQLRAAKAGVNLALELQERGNFDAQAMLCQRLLDRFGNESAAELRKRTVRLLELLAQAQSRLGRGAEASATCERLLREHGDQLDAAQQQQAERLRGKHKPGLIKRLLGRS